MTLHAIPGIVDVVMHSKEISPNDLQPYFFAHFADQRSPRRFAKMNPSARQRPSARLDLMDQQKTVTVADHAEDPKSRRTRSHGDRLSSSWADRPGQG